MGAFKLGDKKPQNSGRKKGTLNRRTYDARQLAESLDLDPLALLLNIAKGDWKALGYTEGTITKVNMGIAYEESLISLENRLSAAKEAIKFLYPQLKSVEISGKDGTDLFAEKLLAAQNRVNGLAATEQVTNLLIVNNWERKINLSI